MDGLTDRIILLGFGLLLLIKSAGTAGPVFAFLTAAAASALGMCIESRRLSYALYLAVFIMAVIEPKTLLFFGVFFYDMVYKKLYLPAAPMLLLFAARLPQSPEKLSLWLLVTALAAILAHKTMRRQSLSEDLIRIRDSGVELNLMLKERNKNLLEKQDYEIHLATLKERNRIAREIHDNVGHMLSRSLLMTGALLTVEKDKAAQESLLNIKDTLDSAMNSIRQSVHDLHDDSVDLKLSINEILESMRPDFDVRFDYDMSADVPRRVKYCLIAMTKEAVSNIIKHSGGDKVWASFREHPGFYQFSIEDNGKNAVAKPDRGIGLKNMEERAGLLNGTFRIRTQNGFSIFVSIPKTEEILCE